MRSNSWLAAWLFLALAGQFAGAADEQASATAKSPKLNIVVIEGEGAINNIRQRTAREMIVQVEDENKRPVAGAVVSFLLPGSGPGGSFSGGSNFLNILTDENGRAIARAFRPNNVAGTFRVNVSASFQGQTATAAITQTNSLTAAAAGAGAAGGAGAGGTGAGGAAAGGAIGAGAGVSTGVLATIGIVAGVAAAVATGIVAGGDDNGGSAGATTTPRRRARVNIGTGPVTIGPP
jgi:hypothetical protein